MTLVHGIGETSIRLIAKELKRRCGADHRDAVAAYLAERKIHAKRMGG